MEAKQILASETAQTEHTEQNAQNEPGPTILFLTDESGSMGVLGSTPMEELHLFVSGQVASLPPQEQNNSKEKKENKEQALKINLQIEVSFFGGASTSDKTSGSRVVYPLGPIESCKVPFSLYHPDGGTPLRDAVLKITDTYENKSKVILVVLTDGDDTSSSSKNTVTLVKERLFCLTKTKEWRTIFIGPAHLEQKLTKEYGLDMYVPFQMSQNHEETSSSMSGSMARASKSVSTMCSQMSGH